MAAEEVADSGMAGATVAAEVAAAGREPAPADRPGLRREIADGLRFVAGNRYLRSIAATTSTANLFGNISRGVFPVFVYVTLGLTPQTVGLIGGGFGAGALVGALIGSRVASTFGVGRAIVGAALVFSPASLLVPLATHDTALLLIGAGGFVGSCAATVYNINQVSLRQSITPEPMLGRMNATMRFLVWGTIPIGQIIGGLIATTPLGVIGAVWVGAIGELLTFLPVLFSSVRSLQTIPEPEPA